MRTVGTGVVECWSNGALVFIRSRIDGLVNCWIDVVDFVSAGASLHHSNTPFRCLEWSPRLVSHQRLLLFREALICLSYSGNAGMECWSNGVMGRNCIARLFPLLHQSNTPLTH